MHARQHGLERSSQHPNVAYPILWVWAAGVASDKRD
eukprot:COSAG01_NODE_47193_length_392_cov_7.174061_1_plen_35_part_01